MALENESELLNAAVGPGTQKPRTTDKPSLDGLDENYYVEILNPLSQTFIGRVASTRPVHAQLRIVRNDQTPTITQNEDDIRRNYGLNLRNPDHESKQHFAQEISIPPGATIRLPGNEAQVIIRQLVNVIMDREGKQILKGDAHARHEVEERIILKQGTMSEFFMSSNVNVRDVINKDTGNNGNAEQSFPSESGETRPVGQADNGSAGTAGQLEPRSTRGRPAKTAV